MVTRFTLDTNACVTVLRGNVKLAQQIAGFASGELSVSTIVVGELYYGAERSKNPSANRLLLNQFLSHFSITEFDHRSAICYAEIRAQLERLGHRIGPYDLQIAATAVAHDFTLITHNVHEFSRVTGLKIEDWE